MRYELEVNECQILEIRARDLYSKNYLATKKGQAYEFSVGKEQRWIDMFVKSRADGFRNFFLRDKRKRVPGHKCFKLCGTVGKNEEHHFSIGSNRVWMAEQDGDVHFFANDSKTFFFYKNNRGSIKLQVLRRR